MLIRDGKIGIDPGQVNTVIAVGQVGFSNFHASQVFDVLKVDLPGATVEHVEEVSKEDSVNQTRSLDVVGAKEDLESDYLQK
jgi:hypothetical protein